jgi:hypothetical protein
MPPDLALFFSLLAAAALACLWIVAAALFRFRTRRKPRPKARPSH